MTIYFINPGRFDIRSLTIFGASSKPNSASPIGRFGTGFKYAVAGILRLGGTITIRNQGDNWTCFAKETEFRGKSIKTCWLSSGPTLLELPFTTELGQHWEPWALYRELRCNQQDEGGGIPSTEPVGGAEVSIEVACKEIEEAHARSGEHFLASKPLVTIGKLELHQGTEGACYYRGIKVFSFEKKSLYHYNILSELQLTEDRTVAGYNYTSAIARELFGLAPGQEHWLKTILDSDQYAAEHGLDFDYSWFTPSESFKKVLAVSYRQKGGNLSAKRWAKAHVWDEIGYETEQMSPEQFELLSTTMLLLEKVLQQHWDPALFISSEADEFDKFSWHQGGLYLHPKAWRDQENLFIALVKAWSNDDGESLGGLLYRVAAFLPDLQPEPSEEELEAMSRAASAEETSEELGLPF